MGYADRLTSKTVAALFRSRGCAIAGGERLVARLERRPVGRDAFL